MGEDQAAGLRLLFGQRSARVLIVADDPWPSRGGNALQLAAALSRTGEQTIVLDAERDSVAALWGARCRYELAHVLEGDRRLVDVIVPGPESSIVVPMRRAAGVLAKQGRAGQRLLARALEAYVEHDSVFVVPVSYSSLASALWRIGAGDVLLCVDEGAAATTAAYAAIKSLRAWRPQPSVRIAFHGTAPGATSHPRFAHLEDVVGRFLGMALKDAGALPNEEVAGCLPGAAPSDPVSADVHTYEILAARIAKWRLPRIDLAARPDPCGLGQAIPF